MYVPKYARIKIRSINYNDVPDYNDYFITGHELKNNKSLNSAPHLMEHILAMRTRKTKKKGVGTSKGTFYIFV